MDKYDSDWAYILGGCFRVYTVLSTVGHAGGAWEYRYILVPKRDLECYIPFRPRSSSPQ